jgi:hypothetical protein
VNQNRNMESIRAEQPRVVSGIDELTGRRNDVVRCVSNIVWPRMGEEERKGKGW